MPKIKPLKILLTGGHAGTVMYAVIEELQSANKDPEIHIVGPKYSYSNKETLSLERKYLSSEGIQYHELDSWKFSRRFMVRTILSSYKLISGFINSLILISKINPDVTVSFGGYLAVPVVIVSYLKGIPVIVHEQVVGLGLANRISVLFAKKAAVSRRESLELIAESKGVLIGNPIRRSICEVKPKTQMGIPPVIFIFTGSRASLLINKYILEILDKLLKQFTVLHLTGSEDFEKFKEIKDGLPNELKNRYKIYDFIHPEDVAGFYQQSDIVIARAGANTVAELMIVKRPSILIPISWSNYDEQNRNARLAADFGIASIIQEGDLSAKRLLGEIERMKLDWKKIVTKVKDKKSPDLHAAENFAKLILNESEIYQKRHKNP